MHFILLSGAVMAGGVEAWLLAPAAVAGNGKVVVTS